MVLPDIRHYFLIYHWEERTTDANLRPCSSWWKGGGTVNMRLEFNIQLGVSASGKARYSRKPHLYVVPNLKTFYTPIPPILRPRLFFHYLRRRSLISGSRTTMMTIPMVPETPNLLSVVTAPPVSRSQPDHQGTRIRAQWNTPTMI